MAASLAYLASSREGRFPMVLLSGVAPGPATPPPRSVLPPLHHQRRKPRPSSPQEQEKFLLGSMAPLLAGILLACVLGSRCSAPLHPLPFFFLKQAAAPISQQLDPSSSSLSATTISKSAMGSSSSQVPSLPNSATLKHTGPRRLCSPIQAPLPLANPWR
ncbi:hypothetical protein Zm00014a_001018 [Zea mays]|uniref:Uncharacterized protein n=1 Tax=Zea mays TaxID=4577 RepID=A0A3L6EI39_MAIZE|nr:hypothetical protein Zm00014a_001018 [Zea mays]